MFARFRHATTSTIIAIPMSVAIDMPMSSFCGLVEIETRASWATDRTWFLFSAG